MSVLQSIFYHDLHIVGVKTTGVYLSINAKIFLTLHDLSRALHLPVFSMKPFLFLLRVLHTFGWFPSILILCAAFPFHKLSKLFHRFIPSSNFSRVRYDLTLDDPFYLPFQISLHVFGISGRLFAISSVRGSVGFYQGNMKHGMSFPPKRYFWLVCSACFLL